MPHDPNDRGWSQDDVASERAALDFFVAFRQNAILTLSKLKTMTALRQEEVEALYQALEDNFPDLKAWEEEIEEAKRGYS